MTSFTNYDSITSKDGPLDDTNQDKKEATPFLQSILRNKFLVTLVVVVVSSVVFMTYSAIHQEVATTTPITSLLRLDSAGGGIIGSSDGSGGGQRLVGGTGIKMKGTTTRTVTDLYSLQSMIIPKHKSK
mmetsp:Transcript_64722/g.72347  ORF Transcript_64722/g.72347 Transcript_64722/m.72347 type:complete len:129 (-) Transcript_64722:228-614(-)